MAHRVVSLLCNDSAGMGGKADFWQAIRADVFMSSRPRRLNSLARRQRMCPNTIRAHRPCSHLQVDIPERDAPGNEPSRLKTGQPVGWTTTTLLASLAAIAGSPQGS